MSEKYTYKEYLNNAMNYLYDNQVNFIGYNIKSCHENGIEMPLAENLMTGIGIGMALENKSILVYFERFDFITNALDQIINQLDKIKEISHNEYSPNLIIRCVVGNIKTPLYTGKTHTQDFSFVMQDLVSFPVVRLTNKEMILPRYKHALNSLNKHSTMLVEYKDLYNE